MKDPGSDLNYPAKSASLIYIQHAYTSVEKKGCDAVLVLLLATWRF